MKKILFIINPLAGTKRQKQIVEKTALKLFKKDFYDLQFAYTEYAGHAFTISNNARNIFDVIVAVGGDGTIHEVAQAVVNSQTTLGVIPMGSGNGLARSLKIPLNIKEAINNIQREQTILIDTIKCNNEYILNVAGFGFDALIGDIFNHNMTQRGGLKYVYLVAKQLFDYVHPTLTFEIEDQTFTRTFFIGAVANSKQYGLNVEIAPTANITDGKFELVFISKFPAYQGFKLAVEIFSKRIHTSKYVETLKIDKLIIKNNKAFTIHLDGEPRTMFTDIQFEIAAKSLRIIV